MGTVNTFLFGLLQDLEEMTMSFRNTSLTNTFSEKTMNLTSDLNKSKFTQGAGLSGQAWQRSLPQHHSVPGADSEEDTWGVKKTSQHFGGLGSSRMHDLPSEPPLPNLRTNRFGFTADCSSEMPSMPEMRSVSRMESHAPDAQVHRFGQSQSGRYKQEDLKNFENDQTWKSTAAAKHSRPEMSDSATEEHTSRYGVAEKFAQDRFGVKGTTYTGADMDNDRRGFRPFVKTEEPAAKYGQGFGLHYNKENLELPATPELTSIKLEDSTVSEVGQPRLPRPLADSNLDLPPTPKFMGSYHFMNSKR
ncbi:hypothetical protein BaRGS_00021001 [Batillaria attramentaria]|uniref:Uncharacterized protein n=1 Tax=Batillaria attramentaria TaxID=370345 RepID=A0ABD0KKV1_9CAEN